MRVYTRSSSIIKELLLRFGHGGIWFSLFGAKQHFGTVGLSHIRTDTLVLVWISSNVSVLMLKYNPVWGRCFALIHVR